jgi:molecular chaperone GrpE
VDAVAEETSRPVPGGEVEALRAALFQAEAKAAEHWEAFLRCRADLENYRKRVERDLERRVRMGKSDLVLPLLEVVDNFQLALEVEDDAGLRAGVEVIFRQLQKLLAMQGVEPVACVGEPFDPALHEAVAVCERPDLAEDTVTHEIRRGYRMQGELLRAARVRVARSCGE